MLRIGPLRPPRRRVAAALVAAALLPACENVSPYVEHSFVRVGAPLLYEPLQTTRDDASGPFPGASLALGTLVEQGGTHATALEVEYAYRRLETGGPLDGFDQSFYAGARRFWNLDGRLRPHAGFGALWEGFHVYHLNSGAEPSGFGVYGDVGLDYMLTPLHSIGVRLRDSPRYEFADRHHGIRNGIELALIASWNF